MINLTAVIPKEILDVFNKDTDLNFDQNVTLSFAYNELTEDYYLAFVNDLIVIHNNVVTLNNGLITTESLSYLDEEKTSHEVSDVRSGSILDSYYGDTNG